MRWRAATLTLVVLLSGCGDDGADGADEFDPAAREEFLELCRNIDPMGSPDESVAWCTGQIEVIEENARTGLDFDCLVHNTLELMLQWVEISDGNFTAQGNYFDCSR